MVKGYSANWNSSRGAPWKTPLVPAADDARGPRSGAQSVERALRVLQSFGAADLGISEIAQRAELSLSTTHRLVRALVAAGLVVQDQRTDRYGLGPALVVLGRHAEERLGYGRALRALEGLAERTGESVNLGIRAGDDVLVVLDVASRQPLRFDQTPGSRVPVHTSAMGKCLLAFGSSVRDAIETLPKLEAVTPRTITDRSALASELERVRERGWALNDEERVPGVRAVAAPVLDEHGRAIAAIAVQGPALRLTDDRLDAVAAHLAETARVVGPLLGAVSATTALT